MIRTAPFLLLSVLAACGGPDGRADVAAEAGGESLSPDGLATWVARVPSGQPTTRDAEFVAIVWVDYTLLAAAGGSTGLTDSTTVTAALLPDLSLLTLRQWHDSLVARRPRVAAGVVDSLYAGNDVRIFQQILIPLKDQQDVRAIAAARAQVDSLLAQLRNGADFAQLARARSQDSTSRAGGFLPVMRRGMPPPQFERAAWPIKPGAIGVVPSPSGIHVLRRPGLADVRDRLLGYAQSLATAKADSLHLDSLTTARHLTVTEKAVPALRAWFEDPASRRTTPDPLVTWDSGKLGLTELAPWIDLLAPRAYLDLRGASDLTLERFAKEVGQQHLLLEEARTDGAGVTPVDRAALDGSYLRSLRESLSLLGASDSTILPKGEGPTRVAALLDGFVADKIRWRPLPSALAAVLRERSGYRLHQAGIEAAVKAARERVPPKPAAGK